jgi:hypothetical protein
MERKLPIGIQTFEKLRRGGYLYADKTAYLTKLASQGQAVFLSRPRRFGKSLFCSTLAAYFEGKKELFDGSVGGTRLAIADTETEWKSYPVLHFLMNDGSYRSPENTISTLDSILRPYEELYGQAEKAAPPAVRFANIIKVSHKRTGMPVVVIIDEYDKPLTDTLEDASLNEYNRNVLQDFYGVLKANDSILKFIFLTGVTKFSKVSIFSTLNQLRDISMTAEYAEVCGITEAELESVFAPELQKMAQNDALAYPDFLKKIKKLYDGYHFGPGPNKGLCNDIYNPFSILNCFANQACEYAWFQSGTPTFLAKHLQSINYDIRDFDKGIESDFQSIYDYRIENPDITPLLYQTGYLTFRTINQKYQFGTVGFPNEEVRVGFLKALLPAYIKNPPDPRGFFVRKFVMDLDKGDLESFMNRVSALFSSIAYNAKSAAETSARSDEHSFQVLLYLVFTLMGEFCNAEEHSSQGRADLIVDINSRVYCFELKIDGNATAQEALDQIEQKGYLAPYRSSGKELIKVGVVFEPKSHKVKEWRQAH